ncbi:yeats family-domain-containing protein [Protomyces lactucae-debilis]|uniref:Protein AF-9 homolog n=1 Tax=Protomyces lactucae-debilis TaxID=2754530 RepID=A0A1Y2FQ51_PROLT|nr:yeats family-domain-containing protein [Protomyces lactucae-debilis]ORY84835.1 yeats family-domain-containing protein [Protomyces lactucae-debilis]
MAPARVSKCSIYRPILIGNTAEPLGDRRNPASDHTHTWTIAVKGLNNADLSPFIKKVIFKLHDTYPNAARSIEAPPFEVTETGWGEFDIQVKIFFVQEASEKPVTLYHRLKLHPYGPEVERLKAADQPIPQGMLHVSSWQYDEVVFNEPTEQLYDILTRTTGPGAGGGGALLPLEKSKDNVFCQRSEQEELDRLESAISKVDAQTRLYRDKILAMEKK